MMNHSINWAALGFAAFCLAGCVSAQVQFEDIEVTRQNVTFNGLPANAGELNATEIPEALRAQYAVAEPGSDFTLPVQQFAYANAASQSPDGIDAALTLQQVTVVARDGRDLSFLRRVVLTVTPQNQTAAVPRVIVDYSSECDPGAKDGKIVLPIVGSSFTINPWQMQASVYELAVTGRLDQLPRETWAVDVTLTLSGNAEYQY